MSNPRVPYRWAPDRPPLPPLDGARLLVHVVVNVEVWPFDQPLPRALLSSPHGARPVPDVPNFSWAEYGMRCGLPRLLQAFGQRAIPVSASCNAAVIDVYPRAAEAMLEAGWEFIAHGVEQRSLVAEDDEAAVIAASLDRLEAFTGTRPRGWLGPGLAETAATPDVLRRHGIDHVYDWVLDDLPEWLVADGGPLLALPYSLELNDSVLHAVESYPATELVQRVRATVDTYEAEITDTVRVLTLPLHPHLLGVPHRVAAVTEVLDLLAGLPYARFVTGTRIADWFRAMEPPPAT